MASIGWKRAWVADLEKNLADGNPMSEMALWKKHSIYRVPAAVKDLNPRAYRPQVVSLGPFHHGDDDLRLMEEHKRRALAHLLRRAGKPLEEFVAAVEEVAEEMEDAYQDLGDQWRGERNRERLLEVMITDGCFLLEMMRMAAASGRPDASDYAPNDPVFSRHGTLYTVPYVRRDMLIVENQLPLLVLEKLVAVESGKQTGDQIEDLVKKMVLRFLSPSSKVPPAPGPGLHPLDVLRKSLLNGPYQKPRGAHKNDDDESGIIRSAAELYEAGIRFRKSRTDSLHDISFSCGVLSLPAVVVDDSTEYMFLNLMAFERLHAGAGNDVTAYVFFMDNIVDSSKDVALLTSKGIIQNAVGSDKAVARLFNGLCKDVVLDPASELDAVHRMVNRYCRKPCHVWRANLIHTYFRSPWAFLSLAAAVFLLVMTVTQTVYTVLQFYHDSNGGGSTSPSSAPAPR